jgi:hypothetical protein
VVHTVPPVAQASGPPKSVHANAVSRAFVSERAPRPHGNAMDKVIISFLCDARPRAGQYYKCEMQHQHLVLRNTASSGRRVRHNSDYEIELTSGKSSRVERT